MRSCWAIGRPAWWRRHDEEGRASPGPGGDDMTHPYDGSSIDLERALVRYMAERKRHPTRAATADRGGGDDGRPGAGRRCLHRQRRERQPIDSAERGRGHDRAVGRTDGERRADARAEPRERAAHLQLRRLHRARGRRRVRGQDRCQGRHHGVRVVRHDVPEGPGRQHRLRPDLPDRHGHPRARPAGTGPAARPVAHPQRRQPGRRVG